MSRAPRPQFPGITLHVVQRGHNRDRTFFSDSDCRTYLQLLSLQSSRFDTQIHAYVLMTNHVHLLMTSSRPDGISRTMQHVAGTYSRCINERIQRRGSLWEGRFRSCPVDSDFYLLACYRYIELNPVRAGIVSSPRDYRWSSYRENAGYRALSVCAPHASYLALGNSAQARTARYRALVHENLPDQTIRSIRHSLAKGNSLRQGTLAPRHGV